MKLLIGFILGSIISALGCSTRHPQNNQDLIHVLNITNCDSLNNDSIYLKNTKFKFPTAKPHNIREAMTLLDSTTNDFSRHKIRICDGYDLYFGYALAIRNEWVRHGEEELSDQLFEKLKLKHVDYSSGCILTYYKAYLLKQNIFMADTLRSFYKKHPKEKIDTIQLAEYEKIDNEINEMIRTSANTAQNSNAG